MKFDKALCINLTKEKLGTLERIRTEDGKFHFHFFNNSKDKFFPGMPAVILNFDRQRGYVFSHAGTISEYSSIQFDPNKNFDLFKRFVKENPHVPSKRVLHDISITSDGLRSEDKTHYTLQSMRFSLPFITNFRYPERHFPGVRFIDSLDYENIVNNKVYISRTVFGELLNALPMENRLEIIDTLESSRLRLLSPRTNSIRVDSGYQLLKEFLLDTLYPKGNLIIHSYDLIQKVKIRDFSVDTIGFSGMNENADRGFDYLSNQRTRFIELFSFDQKVDFFASMEAEIIKNARSEEQYARRFDKAGWPLSNN